MKDKSKIIGMIVGVILFILLISGITYAVYKWATVSEENKVVEGTASCFDVTYTKGSDIGSNEDLEKLIIGSSYSDGLSTTIKIKLDSSCDVTSGVGTIYLNTTEVSSILIDDSLNLLNYVVRVGSSSVASGVINSSESIPIYEDFSVTTSEKSITVYVWLNGENVTDDNLEEVLSSVYKGNITAKVESR